MSPSGGVGEEVGDLTVQLRRYDLGMSEGEELNDHEGHERGGLLTQPSHVAETSSPSGCARCDLSAGLDS